VRFRCRKKRFVVVAETEGDQPGLKRDAMHALIVLVGGEDTGHLRAVPDPVKGTGTVFDMVESGVTQPALELRQPAVQSRVDQRHGHVPAGATPGIQS
jgi:hypothetical protein